jgi:hypothetical protein
MSKVIVGYQTNSLLAANFNGLWCTALNLVGTGKPVAYFAMLHDDVGPEEWWLDKLIAEMEEQELDVLGVAVPMKSGQGLTSLAIASDDSNWNPRCRITMHELYELPETFTSEDVGGRLLINTGCWVCRFDPQWASGMHFTINDRIIFDEELGRYRPQVEPEDWYFSRRCHELGLRVGATRSVAVEHVGEASYMNTYAWGSERFDSHYVSESVLPQLAGTTRG